MGRLVGHDTNTHSVIPGKPDDEIRCEVFLDLEKIIVVYCLKDDVFHIVGSIGIFRNNMVECDNLPIRRINAGYKGRIFHIILGQKRKQAANVGYGIGT